MSVVKQQTLEEKLEELKAHETMIRSMEEKMQEEEYCLLLEKAQNLLGDLSPHIAVYYYNYAVFLLNKIEKCMDIFNPEVVPNAQEDDFIDQYDELYDDDSLDGANRQDEQKKQKSPFEQQKNQPLNLNSSQIPFQTPSKPSNNQQKVIFQDDNVQITEQDNKPKQKMSQNPAQPTKQQNYPVQDEEQDLTDIEICYENFMVALNILNKELSKLENGQTSPLDKPFIIKYKFHTHSRLGELYLLDQKYDQCIDEFRTVIKVASDFDHPETRRLIALAHFNIGNALLHQNLSGCQEKAINEYCDAVINMLKFIEETEHYNISKFEIPSLEKPKIDRYQYLPAPFDNEVVIEIKDVMSAILDKIEDTYEQIGVRTLYEAEKQKMSQQKQQAVFKEVPKDVKVTNLGTFGNRKRPPSQNIQNVPAQAQSTNSPKIKVHTVSGADKSQVLVNADSTLKQQPKSEQKTEGVKVQSETKAESNGTKLQQEQKAFN